MVGLVSFGGKDLVVDYEVINKPGRTGRRVTVKVPVGLSHIAGALAWNIGEAQGWRMGNGSSYGWPGKLCTIDHETGNGRVWATAYAH